MTELEAINRLKYRIETASHIVGVESGNSFEDIEMAIAALEKQVTKKPLNMSEECGLLIGNCLCCNEKINQYLNTLYCEYCGQKIDWN